jgi:hypothetical protein
MLLYILSKNIFFITLWMRLMKNKTLITMLLVCSSPAFAETTASKFYAGVDLGSAKIENRAQAIADTFVNVLGGSSTVTQTVRNGALRLYGGYKAFENADFELGYLQSRDFDTSVSGVTGPSYSNTAYSVTGSVKVSGFDYSVLLRPDRSTGMNGFFLRLGGHSYKAEANTTVSIGGTNASINTKESGTGVMYGIGYDVTVNETVDVRFGITQMKKMAGLSDNDATYFSVGVKGNF